MSLHERARGRAIFIWDDTRIECPEPGLFDPDWWHARGALTGRAAGRGAAYFVTGLDGASWVLRHNRRGGMLACFNHDRYLWTGRTRARPGAELRLLADLRGRGLPVPEPVAARIMRGTGCYRGDLIMARVPGARPLADHLAHKPLAAAAWRALGGTLARFHHAGAWHGDLNARNILLDDGGGFYLIDFDKAWLRTAGPWQRANLARLRRSLDKFSRTTAAFYFTADDWTALRGGYHTNLQK